MSKERKTTNSEQNKEKITHQTLVYQKYLVNKFFDFQLQIFYPYINASLDTLQQIKHQ